MSEPKRYYANWSLDDDDMVEVKMTEHPEGGYIKLEDYARLKAEVERLEANTTKLCTHGDAEIARLKAEVERLTRAGDAMEMTLQADFNGCPYEPTIVREAIIYWRNAKTAAKKGGQP